MAKKSKDLTHKYSIPHLVNLGKILVQEKLAVLVKDKAFWARLTVLLQAFQRTTGFTVPFPTGKPAREIKSYLGAVQHEIAPSSR